MTGALPQLFIIGAPKAGTTTLAAWWDSHPKGFTAPEKEVGFFTPNFDRGLDWYRSRFAGMRADQIGCDASPGYLYSDEALDRLTAAVPDAHLVVILREPVARVWSHWCYNVAIGVEPRSFARVLREELRDPTVTPPDFPLGYLEGSRYIGRLRAVTERFHRDQLLVLFMEELQAQPQETFAALCRHVGVPAAAAPVADRRNTGMFPRHRRLQRLAFRARTRRPGSPRLATFMRWNLGAALPKMPERQRQQVRAKLHPELPELAQWLGRDLPQAWTA